MTSRLLASLVLVSALFGCATQPPQATGEPPVSDGPSPAAEQQRVEARKDPLGDSSASCVESYSPEGVAGRSFAFDGTVIDVGPGTTNKPGKGRLPTSAVTFEVVEWWRGGEGRTVTIDMDTGRTDEVPAQVAVGTRLLVSGEPRWGGEPLTDAIAWGCGFTRYYDADTAADWRNATTQEAAAEGEKLGA